MELARVVRHNDRIFCQCVCCEHQIHIADGLPLPLQRAAHPSVMIRSLNGPVPHFKAHKPGLNGRFKWMRAEFFCSKAQFSRDNCGNPDRIRSQRRESLNRAIGSIAQDVTADVGIQRPQHALGPVSLLGWPIVAFD